MTRSNRQDRPGSTNGDPHDPEHEPGDESPGPDTGDLATLEFLDGEDLTWYVYRLAPTGKILPGGVDALYVLKFKGRLDLDAIKDQLGGGFYRVIVRQGREIVDSATFGIDAPQRPLALEAPPPATPASSSDTTHGWQQQLGELRAEIRELALRPPPRSVSDDLMKAVLDRALAPPTTNVEAMLGLFQRGIDLGSKATNGESWPAIIRETIPDVLEFLRQRPDPAASAVGAPPAINTRALWFVTTLERALAHNLKPRDLADDVGDFMSDEEIAGLVDERATPALVIQQLGRLPGGAELVKRPELEQYLGEFLRELRTPPKDDGDD